MDAESIAIPLSGATRLHMIVGDPIAQVKSPAGLTRSFLARGRDAILVPVQVAPADLDLFLNAATAMKNLDGIVVTVPHKFASFAHCASTTSSAALLGAVNVMRRDANGRWRGHMVDGFGFVEAAKKNGRNPKGDRALLIGAGGAGSAIGLALIDAGVRELAIHDADAGRRDALIHRLGSRKAARVTVGSSDPSGFDFVANATPAGMREGDALPVDVEKLAPSAYVGCVVTAPPVTPLIAAARARGCRTGVGIEMFEALQEAIVDILLGEPEPAR